VITRGIFILVAWLSLLGCAAAKPALVPPLQSCSAVLQVGVGTSGRPIADLADKQLMPRLPKPQPIELNAEPWPLVEIVDNNDCSGWMLHTTGAAINSVRNYLSTQAWARNYLAIPGSIYFYELKSSRGGTSRVLVIYKTDFDEVGYVIFRVEEAEILEEFEACPACTD